MRKHIELIITGFILLSAFTVLIYFNYPRRMFTYGAPIKINTTESARGGMINWTIDVCRRYGGNFTANRFLVNLDNGTLYELAEGSTASTLSVGECDTRQRSAVITSDVPAGTYYLMIRTIPDPSIYNFKNLEIRSSNTIKIN